jgi:hypothetical protein
VPHNMTGPKLSLVCATGCPKKHPLLAAPSVCAFSRFKVDLCCGAALAGYLRDLDPDITTRRSFAWKVCCSDAFGASLMWPSWAARTPFA